MKRFRWRTKLVIIIALGIFVFSLFCSLITSKLRENIFHQYVHELIKPLSSILISHMKHCMFKHTPDHFQGFMEDIEAGKEIRSIDVLNDSGRIVFSSKAEKIETFDSVFINELKNNTIDDFHTISSMSSSSMHQSYTIIKKEESCNSCHNTEEMKRVSYMGVTINYNVEKKVRGILMLFDFFSFFLIIILFTIIIITIHHRVFQVPFSHIAKGVKEITSGYLKARIKIKTPGELSQLADGIKAMAEKLNDAINTLHELHKQEIDRAGQLATVGELAASVAHEIKNPVSGIGNALDIILDQYSDMKEIELFREMRSQIDRVYKTIEDLMNFARPRLPNFQVLDLQEILRSVVHFYRKQFQKSNIILVEKYDAELSNINGDEELLKQVFVNILINALQGCSKAKEGRIEIKIENNPMKNKINISISDNGKGISQENIGNIFKPFYTTKHKGTGLGLSLSRSIVRKHYGDIYVDSKVGEGAQFTIQFPLSENP